MNPAFGPIVDTAAIVSVRIDRAVAALAKVDDAAGDDILGAYLGDGGPDFQRLREDLRRWLDPLARLLVQLGLSPAAAAALGTGEALQLVLLYAAYEPPKLERAALRWFRRYLDEKEPSLLSAQIALAALSELGAGSDAAGGILAGSWTPARRRHRLRSGNPAGGRGR
jgi:hypothetical protein